LKPKTKASCLIILFSAASILPPLPVWNTLTWMPSLIDLSRQSDSSRILTHFRHNERLADTMNARHFRELIVRPSLAQMGMPAAEELLMFTAAVESELAEYVRQNGTDGNYGVGRGPFQMEPQTYYWLANLPGFAKFLAGRDPDDMVWDFRLATMAARLRYRIVHEDLPPADDTDAMARYWKKWYNGNSPAGLTEDQAKSKYLKLVKGIGR
jgi:hypothetical protein